jgi:hypothetical protein
LNLNVTNLSSQLSFSRKLNEGVYFSIRSGKLPVLVLAAEAMRVIDKPIFLKAETELNYQKLISDIISQLSPVALAIHPNCKVLLEFKL